jgi:hypothetical protein
MARRLGWGLLWGVVAYVGGALAGAVFVGLLSSNPSDRELEAIMTGAFVTGPIAALVGFLAGAVRAGLPPAARGARRKRLGIALLLLAALGVAAAFLFHQDAIPDRVEHPGPIPDRAEHPGPIPDRAEAIGPFEIVTHKIRYMTGWNEGRLHSATTENYSLRYRGQPFTFEGRSGMFGDSTARYEKVNAIITFPTTEPALVVNVGDPNNRSFFYLVRYSDGAARVEYLGESSGNVSADWLDPAPGTSTGERDITVHRARLDGGRWLLLGEFSVLDVRSLKAYRFEPPPGAYLNQFKSAIALSPDQTSFVRLASGESPDNLPLLVVFDFVGGSSYTLPIDRRLMRYNDWAEIDAAWLDHYFEWRRTEDEHDHLVQRLDAAPLPYRGRLSVDADGYREYDLLPVKPEMRDTLVGFLQRELAADRFPPEPYGTSVSVRIGADTVHVMSHEDNVGLWMDRGTDSRLVEDIAKRFDEALGTGRYDDLFAP